MEMEGFKGHLEVDKKGNEILNEEHITTEEFERQFSEEQLVEIDGYDPIPYTTITPENPTSENWVVYVGGFSQGKETYLDEIKSLVHSGRKVLFTNPTKGIDGENDSQLKIPDTIQNKSRALDEVLKAAGAESVDFVAHSQGAAVVTTYAAQHPDTTNKMVLECPAGLMEGIDTRLSIMARFIDDKVSAVLTDTKNILGKSGLRGGRSFSGNLIKDVKYRWEEEVPGVAEVDIAPLLKTIKERDYGTEVILLNANEDKAFSPERIEETLGDNPLEEYIDRWAMYERKKASHSAPIVERPGLLRQILE